MSKEDCPLDIAAPRSTAQSTEPPTNSPSDPPPTSQGSKPRQVSAYAEQHLSILGRNVYEFRCLPDSEQLKAKLGGKGMHRFVGTFLTQKNKLRQYNEQGHGVFVQVNANNGKGNKAANIEGAPCYFVDLDGAPRENIDRLGIPPNLVLETSPGKWHAYWQIIDLPLDHFRSVQKRLAALCQSDPVVHDLPRVMRLAGFLHQKDPDAPFLVRPESRTGAPVSNDKFLLALEAAEQREGIVATSSNKANDTPASSESPPADLKRSESALRFLISKGLLDVGGYDGWRDTAFGLHGSHGPDGYPLFHQLSSEAQSYVDEADCRRFWDSIKGPSQGPAMTMASFFKRAAEAGWTYVPSSTNDEQASNSSGAPATGKKDAAVLVLEQANDAGDDRFLDLNGIPHVTFSRRVGEPGPLITARIESSLYRGVLLRRFQVENGAKVLPKEQLNSAIDLLKAEAIETATQHPVHLRVAASEGRIYIDLAQGDGRAVEVDASGYRVVQKAPVRFLSGSRGPLPEPNHGGNLDDLAGHMPNLQRQDVQRLLAFMIGTLNPHGIFPVLGIGGGQGHGKTNLGDKCVSVTDPPTTREDARGSLARKEQDLIIRAQNAHVLFFDNVSRISDDQSDHLCKLLGGTAFSTRSLYSNGDEFRISLRRPVIMTSIGTPTSRGDLLDRMLSINPGPIIRRRPEEEIWGEFEVDRPKLFGLVLSGVSAALRNRADVAEREARGEIRLPRLADFARFVEGAHEVLELAPGEFSDMLRDEQGGLQAEAATGEALGAALVRYFSKPGAKPLSGSAAELLHALANSPEREQRGWPSSNKVRGVLERIAPGLRNRGIEVRLTAPHGKRNVWTMQICTTPDFQPDRLDGSCF